jgi:hypothetical protein
MKKVIIFDTSLLCCYLEVPGKDTCGSGKDVWNKAKVEAFLKKELGHNDTLVLPLASIIETGNHIAQAGALRYEKAELLSELIRKTADSETPWAAFTDQSNLWNTEGLKKLARVWPALASSKLTIGDTTIKDVADYYSQMGFDVIILTADSQLKTYEPAKPSLIPRRKK